MKKLFLTILLLLVPLSALAYTPRTIVNPASNAPLSSSIMRNELQLLENEISSVTNTPFTLTTAGSSGAATYSAGTLNIPQYSSSGGSGTVGTSTNETAGFLSYWTTNSATPALLGKVATGTISGAGGVTVTAGQSIIGSGLTITCSAASGSVTGCLSSTDWTTFNGKQASGNYITALTGDVTASGSGSVTATLATVNGNVGSFTNANITVNGKGLITAASNGTAGGSTFGQAFEIDASNWLSATTTNTYGINANARGITYGYGIGDQLLGYASSTNRSTIFGLSAGGNNATTSATVASTTVFGYLAGSALTTGVNNVLIGAGAGRNLKTSDANTIIGVGALSEQASNIAGVASANTIIGYNAGANISGGFSGASIIIGANVLAPSASSFNVLNIGNVIYGTGIYSNATTPSSAANGAGWPAIGIASSSPHAEFSIHANHNISILLPKTLFEIGSTTAAGVISTLFTVDNVGNTFISGKVGIGTTTPAAQLGVAGNVYITGTLNTGTIIPNGPYTTNLSAFDLGATGSRWNAVWAGAYNIGTSTFSLKSDANSNLGIFTAASGGGTQALTVTSAGNVGIGSSTPFGKFAVNPIAGDANQFVVGSSTRTSFIINNAGNVGIGSTSPMSALTIVANNVAARGQLTIDANGSSVAQQTFYNGNTELGTIFGNTSGNTFNLGSVTSDLNLNTVGNINFQNNSVTKMTMDSSGNVGIGMTPVRKLDVMGGGNSIGTLTTDWVAGSAGTAVIYGTGANTGNTTYGAIQAYNTGGTLFGNLVLNGGGGNVGIGTTTPFAKLSLQSNSSTQTIFSVSTTTTLTLMRIDANGHLITGGIAPTCGTGCTSVTGDDRTMKVLTSAVVSSITVNFANTYTTTPICIVTNEGGTVAVGASTTPTTVVISSLTALTSVNLGLICQVSSNFTF